MAETLAERVFTLTDLANLGALERRMFDVKIHQQMRERGILPGDYEIRGTEDPATGAITIRAVLIDPMDRPMRFDDRGIY